MLLVRVQRSACAQVAEQVGEGGLEGVVVFPVREVGDVVFANLLGQVFAGIGVIAAPVADAVNGHQSDRKKFPTRCARVS